MKRILVFFLAIALVLTSSIPAYACDENQSKTHVLEIFFGDDAASYESNDKAKMLINAVYLCCEQSDSQGQDKLDFLKKQKVSKNQQIIYPPLKKHLLQKVIYIHN